MSILASEYESGLIAVQQAAMQPPPGTLWTPEWAADREAATAARPKASPSSPVVVKPATVAAPAPARNMSEAERISAIEALRLPGTDAAIASAKADPEMTPTKAAPLIMTAYKKAIRAEFGSEAAYGTYRAAIDSGRARVIAPGLPRVGACTSPSPLEVARHANDVRSEWRDSPALQRDFATAESYANYAAGIATGRIRVYGAAAQAPALPTDAPNFAKLHEDWCAEWARSPALQRDFATAESYANYKEGVATGRVRNAARSL